MKNPGYFLLVILSITLSKLSIKTATYSLYLIFNDNKSKEEKRGKKVSKGFFASLIGQNIYTDITILNSKGILEYRDLLFTGKDITDFFCNGLSHTISDKILINTTIMTKYQFGTYIMK